MARDREPRRTFGEALRDAWTDAGIRQRVRPPAVSWRAQLSELTRSGRGQAFLTDAGVNPGRGARNWRDWLAGDRAASPANQRRIDEAYRRWFGPGFPDVTTWTHAIHGTVNIGGDERDRGDPRNPGRAPTAPLRVDGTDGDWTQLRAAWARRAGPDELGALFAVDVIGEVMEVSAASLPAFPGDLYLVVLE